MKKIKSFFLHHKKTILVVFGVVGIVAFFVLFLAAGIIHYQFKKVMRVQNRGGIERSSGNGVNQVAFAPSDDLAMSDGKKIASIAILVNDVSSVAEALKALAPQQGGRVVSADVQYASNKYKNGVIILQIPENNFTETVEQIRSLSTLVVQDDIHANIDDKKEDLQMEYNLRKSEDDALVKIIDRAQNADEIITATQRRKVLQDEMFMLRNRIETPESAVDVGYVRVVFVQDTGSFEIGQANISTEGVPVGVGGTRSVKQQFAMWAVFGIRVFVILLLSVLLAVSVVIIARALMHKKRQKKTAVRQVSRRPAVKRSRVVKRKKL